MYFFLVFVTGSLQSLYFIPGTCRSGRPAVGSHAVAVRHRPGPHFRPTSPLLLGREGSSPTATSTIIRTIFFCKIKSNIRAPIFLPLFFRICCESNTSIFFLNMPESTQPIFVPPPVAGSQPSAILAAGGWAPSPPGVAKKGPACNQTVKFRCLNRPLCNQDSWTQHHSRCWEGRSGRGGAVNSVPSLDQQPF